MPTVNCMTDLTKLMGMRVRVALAGLKLLWLAMALMLFAFSACAQLDGHGPDAWKVVDIEPGELLQARMGPGMQYPVIETFRHDERGLGQITCVPYYTLAIYQRMSQQERDSLGPRWCMMHDLKRTKAGWVPQRFLMEDVMSPGALSDEELISQAEALVRKLYDQQRLADQGRGQSPIELGRAGEFFSADVVASMARGPIEASPLYGSQDQEISNLRVLRDPDMPLYRGLLTVNADFDNFGKPQRAVFSLRADPSLPGAPLRIIRVEHDGWTFE